MAANSINATDTCFDDLHGDFWKQDITVRLIHTWEARNIRNGNIPIGVEVLLIDSKAVTIQGFISANRLYRFEGKLKSGTIDRLSNFTIRPAKRVYKVTANPLGVIFTDQTSFVELQGSMDDMPTQKFRVQNFQAFESIADTATDLYDIIGHIRVVNGENLESVTALSTTPPPAGGRIEERVFLHVQLEDGETVRVYLWGGVAAAFRGRCNDNGDKPTVFLITTLNPKMLGSLLPLAPLLPLDSSSTWT